MLNPGPSARCVWGLGGGLPAAGHNLVSFGGVGDGDSGGGGAVPEDFLVTFAFLDGMAGWFDTDAGQLVAVYGVKLPVDEVKNGVTKTGADEVLQVLAP